MKYRLKSDDLEIMEREVKEDFEIRKKIKDFETNSLNNKNSSLLSVNTPSATNKESLTVIDKNLLK